MNSVLSSESHQAGSTRKYRESKLPLIPLFYPNFLSGSVEKIRVDKSLAAACLLFHSFKVKPSHSPESCLPVLYSGRMGRLLQG